MKVLAVILVALAVAQAGVVKQSAKPRFPYLDANDESRIINGVESVRHSRPWQVFIRMDNSYFCGGSLIHPRWVLTAAHCVKGFTNFDVYAGAHTSSTTDTTDGKKLLRVLKHYQHAGYTTTNLRDDIALLELAEDAPIDNSTIKPIDYLDVHPNHNHGYTGGQALVSGWGKTSNAGSVSAVLREVNLTVVEPSLCSDFYGGIGYNGTLCCRTDTTPPTSTCNGDSGGPLSRVINGEFVQIGVVSYGSSGGCTQGSPVGFSHVHNLGTWIKIQSGLEFKEPPPVRP